MEPKPNHPYALMMLILSVLSLVSLAVATSGRLGPDEVTILQVADGLLCAVFFADFLLSLYRAPNRWRYFLRWGWLDLLSSVPTVDALRLTRAVRIFRILRLIRGVKATKILAEFILRRRADHAFLAVSLVSVLLVVVASIAILQFETDPASNIKDAQDALWWALSTITTVGYGDRYPVTPGGRIVASFLMVAGVGLFGTLSGFVASWFLKPAEAAQDTELAELLQEVRGLKLALGERSS